MYKPVYRYENYNTLTPLIRDDLHSLKIGDKLVRINSHLAGFLELGDVITIKRIHSHDYGSYPSFVTINTNETGIRYILDVDVYHKFAKYPESKDDQFLINLYQ